MEHEPAPYQVTGSKTVYGGDASAASPICEAHFAECRAVVGQFRVLRVKKRGIPCGPEACFVEC